MSLLTVWFNGWGECWKLGQLAENRQQLIFEYSSEAMQRGLELSPFKLPLRSSPFSEFPWYQSRLPGLIADALPDSWGRRLREHYFRDNQRSPLNTLELLAFLQDRALGALTFESDVQERFSPPPVELALLAKGAQQFLTDGETDVLPQLLFAGGAPQGARPKVLVQYDQASKSLSIDNNAPGLPWLVKFPMEDEHKEVCAIEDLYADMARNCGLNMPDSQYFELGMDLSAFGVKRFDRERGMRVPMISLAGLQDNDFTMANQDYDHLLRVTRALTRDENEVRAAFERAVFNVVFNNLDDHTKNFAFVMDERFHWKLSPCYDITFDPNPYGWHQMSIMGNADKPSRRDLMGLAKSCELDFRWASATIERITQEAGNLACLVANWPIRKETLTKMISTVEANRMRMMM